MNYSENFKFLRKKLSLTQGQLAKRIGKTQGYVSGVENETKNPGMDFLVALKQAMPNLNLNWLILSQGEMFLPPGQIDGDLIEKAKTVLGSETRYAENLSNNIEDYFNFLESQKKTSLPDDLDKIGEI